jgi:hypothetical protein
MNKIMRVFEFLLSAPLLRPSRDLYIHGDISLVCSSHQVVAFSFESSGLRLTQSIRSNSHAGTRIHIVYRGVSGCPASGLVSNLDSTNGVIITPQSIGFFSQSITSYSQPLPLRSGRLRRMRNSTHYCHQSSMIHSCHESQRGRVYHGISQAIVERFLFFLIWHHKFHKSKTQSPFLDENRWVRQSSLNQFSAIHDVDIGYTRHDSDPRKGRPESG